MTAKLVSKLLAVAPSNIIVPVTPLTLIELAAPAVDPLAYKSSAIKSFTPAKFNVVAPKETLVLPIVKEEFARLLLAIDDAVVNIVPVSFGNVRVLSPPVASAAVSIVSFASSVDPSKDMLPLANNIELEPLPATNVVDVKEVNPEIVDAVAPSATLVAPIVKDELANCPLGIALVPNSPVPEL